MNTAVRGITRAMVTEYGVDTEYLPTLGGIVAAQLVKWLGVALRRTVGREVCPAVADHTEK